MSRFQWSWAVPVDVLASRPAAVIAKARRDAVACAADAGLRPADGLPSVTCPPPDGFDVVEVRVTFPTVPLGRATVPVRNLMLRRPARPISPWERP